MKTKDIILIVAIIIVLGLIGFLGYGYIRKLAGKNQNPIATIEVEGYGTIKVELYPDVAPNTVKNFIALANNGFYDGLTFHRTVPEFIIQGGKGRYGNPMLSDIKDIPEEEDKEYTIPGEFIQNGYNNTLRHDRGVISMARLSIYESLSPNLAVQDYNSASSEFFIMTGDNAGLNRQYAAFGRVIEGMDIVDAISNVEVITREEEEDGLDEPVNPPVITKVTVETYGVKYGLPETLDIFDYNQWLINTYGLDPSIFDSMYDIE